MATREFDFIVGPETATLPTAGTPTVGSDLVTKTYADANFVSTANLGAPVASITELKAVAAVDRSDKQLRYVENEKINFAFDAESSATGDDILVLVPDAGTGRWNRVVDRDVAVTFLETITQEKEQILKHVTTPTAPSAGYLKVYAKSDNKLYKQDSGAVEVEIGSGSGGGGGFGLINYITDFDADNGVGTWLTYKDAAGSVPVNGVGGTANSALGTASAVRGTLAFSFNKASADQQGEGANYAFSIDEADKNKTLTIRFDFDASDVSYVAGDMGVFIYDVSNVNLITPSVTTLPGGTGRFEATFSSTDASNYRLILHVATANTNSYSFKYDYVFVGRDTPIIAAPITDWESFTPTGAWSTNTTWTGSKRRVGDTMEVQFDTVTSGAPDAASFRIDIPDGLTIDFSKIPDTSANYTFGHATILEQGVSTIMGEISIEDTTRMNVVYKTANSAEVRISSINHTAPFTFAANDSVKGEFRIPIAEWASSGVNLAASRVEYASNSSTTTSSDTTSFAYGIDGKEVEGFTPSGNTAITKRVRFQTPIQSSDVVSLEFNRSGLGWMSAGSTRFSFERIDAATTSKGAEIFGVSGSTTDVDVFFYNQPYNGADWSDEETAGTKWRVRKSSPNAPAGIQLATATVPGLSKLPTSQIHSYTGKAHGSTNTNNRNFDVHVVTGTAISTSGDSATLGSFYTINEDGIYTISYTEDSRVNEYAGITVNASPTTNITGISPPNKLCQSHSVSAGADYPHNSSVTVRLSVGDIIRPHTSGEPCGTTRDWVSFVITQIVAL